MRVAVPLLLAGALLAGCTSDPVAAPRGPAPSAPAPSAPAPSAPAPSAPTAPVPTAASAGAGTRAVAVYWLGATQAPRGPRLYREFLRRPAAADAVRDAVQAMLTTSPRDPDYRSLWARGTTVRRVERDGTTAVVDLSGQATRNGGGSAFEAMTLQQLVHTATAADPSVRAVRLLVEGQPVETLWGSVDTSRPLTRGPAATTLGPVWLDVEEGGALPASFGGTATVFEATVSWQLRQGDRVVEVGFATATEGAPGRGSWTARADVPPGDYALHAFESSAEDGSAVWLDTKRVRVSR